MQFIHKKEIKDIKENKHIPLLREQVYLLTRENKELKEEIQTLEFHNRMLEKRLQEYESRESNPVR
jgi:uncharacterized protein with von Willebrand factor type A (vWA) domain